MPCQPTWRRVCCVWCSPKRRWLLALLLLWWGALVYRWGAGPSTIVRAQTITIPAAQLFLPLVLQAGPPSPAYEFNTGVVERCDPNAGITYVNGFTAKEGKAVNGAVVAFSYAPDGPIVAKIMSGPHTGYPNWSPGFFSHILGVGGPREGDWYFWIVDDQAQRISVIIYLHTDGQAGEGKCQQGVLRFDQQLSFSK